MDFVSLLGYEWMLHRCHLQCSTQSTRQLLVEKCGSLNVRKCCYPDKYSISVYPVRHEKRCRNNNLSLLYVNLLIKNLCFGNRVT